MDLIEGIRALVGAGGVQTGEDVQARPNASWGRGSCPAKAIVRPASTLEVSDVMRLCHEQNQSVVPWGGLTSLVNGITCGADDIVVSLERMRRIESLDSEAGIMIAQAGVTLQAAQDAAAAAGWLLAVDWGARGSAQIGGGIATNAGGNSVVRYGMMREQVLGLEAVLADGTVISSMNEMLKNNTGYDLKHLFIGSEGTLGIVTRAVLRLRPAAVAEQTAFVAFDDFGKVSRLLKRLGVELEGKLTAFEVLWQNHYHLMTAESGKHETFVPAKYPFYALIESTGADGVREAEQITTVLGMALEDGLIADAVVAQSGQQTADLWAMREDVETLISVMHPAIVFDVSLPVREMEAFVNEVEAGVAREIRGARLVTFGHLGDGNIHLVIGPTHDAHLAETLVYEPLRKIGGSISAEHGIGLEKRQFLGHSRSAEEIALMRSIKRALDPKNILNPGKIFPGDQGTA